jgi:hypothetical protein
MPYFLTYIFDAYFQNSLWDKSINENCLITCHSVTKEEEYEWREEDLHNVNFL